MNALRKFGAAYVSATVLSITYGLGILTGCILASAMIIGWAPFK